jgi:hypothetical protein
MTEINQEPKLEGIPPANFLQAEMHLKERRHFPSWLRFIILAIVALVVLFLSYSLIFSPLTQLSNSTANINNRLISVESMISIVRNDLQTLEAKIPPTMTPTPTPVPPVRWSFNGYVQKIDSPETLPNLNILFEIKKQGTNEPWQLLDRATLSMDGSFSIAKELSSENGFEVKATINNVPAPWQLRLANSETGWQSSLEENTFRATFEKTEAVEPLSLSAFIRRTFIGKVAVITNPDVITALSDIQIMVETSTDNVSWQSVEFPEPAKSDLTGQFVIDHDSAIEEIWYRISAVWPTNYEISTNGLLSLPEFPEWAVSQNSIISTIPLRQGVFEELLLNAQLSTINASLAEALLTPDVSSGVWTQETAEWPFYSTTVSQENVGSLSATWNILLPAGSYKLEAWTPNARGAAIAQYTVTTSVGVSMGHPSCPPYLSPQQFRNGWWDFVNPNSGQQTLIVQLPNLDDTTVTITVAKDEANRNASLDKILTVGPIRFTVINEQINFPECANNSQQ